MGNPDYYTEKERTKCDAEMLAYTGSDEKILKENSEIRIECYKNLPPLP